MTDAHWIQLASAVALAALMAYAVLGGADFGGGVWDLFASGPRKLQQRAAIAHAMGPVWEANHVWLIFLVVVLFTCFPRGYAALTTTLFLPLHLALLGIMLRGAAFVFRGFTAGPKLAGATSALGRNGEAPPQIWGSIFGIASVITPLLLGCVFGVITSGQVERDAAGNIVVRAAAAWVQLYPLGCGLLALSTCAYLASVYLMAETTGELREDFRRRAIIAGTATAALAAAVVCLAWLDATWFFHQLLRPRSLPIVGLGLVFFGASAWAVFSRRPYWSRFFAAGEVLLMLLGWGLSHQEYLIYPAVTFANSAAPIATIRFLMLSLPFGAALVGPSLWLLLKIFKQPRHQSGMPS